LSKKKRKKIKQQSSLHRAQVIIRKSAAIEGLKTAGGLIIPAVSFDMERIADAEAILVEGGYSGRQANIAINNIIRQLRCDIEVGFDKK